MNSYNSQSDENLNQEAEAFDNQIEERIMNGHIPDLRFSKPCNYFYNNPWRRPEYVKLDFYEQYELIRDSINNQLRKEPRNIRVLEVGCGPGYLCLELARYGFNVVGLDLSKKCVDVAIEFANKDPMHDTRGELIYLAGDFFSAVDLVKESFDAVIFLGALHHFPDQNRVLQRAKDLIMHNGIIVVHEPVRDRVTKGNAAFSYLLTTLLSVNNGFYKNIKVQSDKADLSTEIDRIYNLLRYEDETGEKVQSINDNEAGYAEMYPQLKTLFKEEIFKWRYAFFHEFIGGLRFEDDLNVRLATFLREMDRTLVEHGVLQATEFFFVGRK